jgi:hypothetical protein
VNKFHRLCYILVCLLVLQLLSASANADILLDDFSTNLSNSNLTFYALNSSGNIDTVPPSAGNSFSTTGRISLAPNNMARWTDTVSPTSPLGILGGVRSGEIRNGAASTQTSSFRINNGTMGIDSPSRNMLCLACLSYNFSAAPQDFSSIARLIISFTGSDLTAQRQVGISVSITDGVTTSAGLLDNSTTTIGTNYYWLTGLPNWSRLNKSEITGIDISFTTNVAAVDYSITEISFTHAPEPNGLFFLGIAFAFPAILRYAMIRRSKANRIEMQ